MSTWRNVWAEDGSTGECVDCGYRARHLRDMMEHDCSNDPWKGEDGKVTEGDMLRTNAQTYMIFGDVDKPFHRPECECDRCEGWRVQKGRPTHAELREEGRDARRHDAATAGGDHQQTLATGPEQKGASNATDRVDAEEGWDYEEHGGEG